VIAASFRHRTSRAGDPLLHWHCLVANMAEGSDGKWSAIVHPDLFRNAKAAGEIFQATFRAELTASLGVEWVPGRHVHEIAGVPRHLIDAFSKRSDQIEAWLAATGTPDTPAGRQAAVLATRRNKPEMEHERLDTRLEGRGHRGRLDPRRRRTARRLRRPPRTGRLRPGLAARYHRVRRARHTVTRRAPRRP
jgi:conjugative relaxase-like TrwC/TraI family protein